jgi:hypothetical protein
MMNLQRSVSFYCKKILGKFLFFYSKLSHPCVISFWGIFTDSDSHKYIVTEVDKGWVLPVILCSICRMVIC